MSTYPMAEVILNNYNFATGEEFDYLDELQHELDVKAMQESESEAENKNAPAEELPER